VNQAAGQPPTADPNETSSSLFTSQCSHPISDLNYYSNQGRKQRTEQQPPAGGGGSKPDMASAKIAPSMLSEAERMVRLGADWLHMDTMVRSTSDQSRSITSLVPRGRSRASTNTILVSDPNNRFLGRVEYATVAVLGI
jgi:hypothetical protein